LGETAKEKGEEKGGTKLRVCPLEEKKKKGKELKRGPVQFYRTLTEGRTQKGGETGKQPYEKKRA